MYNIDYYFRLLRNNTNTARDINNIRWEFVKELNARTVLDYGCGVGWFKAFAPEGIEVDTYDILPVPQTGITKDSYDLITFWDVLEHIPDFNSLKINIKQARYIACSVPLLSNHEFGIEDILKWKHFKPGEHLHFWRKDIFESIFKYYDFKKIKEEQPECPPREDIWNFIFAFDG